MSLHCQKHGLIALFMTVKSTFLVMLLNGQTETDTVVLLYTLKMIFIIKRRYDVENVNNIESVWLEIQQVYKKSIIIGSLYCRSQKDVSEFLNLLSETMDGATNENRVIILLGD